MIWTSVSNISVVQSAGFKLGCKGSGGRGIVLASSTTVLNLIEPSKCTCRSAFGNSYK